MDPFHNAFCILTFAMCYFRVFHPIVFIHDIRHWLRSLVEILGELQDRVCLFREREVPCSILSTKNPKQSKNASRSYWRNHLPLSWAFSYCGCHRKNEKHTWNELSHHRQQSQVVLDYRVWTAKAQIHKRNEPRRVPLSSLNHAS